MAENPTMANTEDWDEAEKASIAALTAMGLNDAKSLRDTKDRFAIWRQQNTHTREQVKAITELFLNRKKYADLTGTNITEIGKLAGQTHIQSQQKAQDGATDLGRVAGMTDFEIQAVEKKFYAGWAGPITMIGKLLNACGATELGNKCIDFANDLRPAPIRTDVAFDRMKQRQGDVTIDANRPAITAISVLNNAMLMTNPDNIGMGASAGAQTQAQIAAVKAANANAGAPAAPSAVAPAPAPAVPASSATTANIAQLTADLIARAKAGKINLPEQTAAAQVSSILRIDNASGNNHSGKLDTQAEVDAYKRSTAYLSLSKPEQAFMDKYASEALTRRLGAPAPAGPAPVLN